MIDFFLVSVSFSSLCCTSKAPALRTGYFASEMNARKSLGGVLTETMKFIVREFVTCGFKMRKNSRILTIF